METLFIYFSSCGADFPRNLSLRWYPHLRRWFLNKKIALFYSTYKIKKYIGRYYNYQSFQKRSRWCQISKNQSHITSTGAYESYNSSLSHNLTHKLSSFSADKLTITQNCAKHKHLNYNLSKNQGDTRKKTFKSGFHLFKDSI